MTFLKQNKNKNLSYLVCTGFILSTIFLFLLIISSSLVSAITWNVDFKTVSVNDSIHWDGNAWSDVRWLNIDGSNANQNIDIGNYNFSASFLFGDAQFLTGIQHGQLTLFNHNEASDVSGSKVLDTASNDTGVITLSVAITADEQEFQNWTSPVNVPGLPLLSDGVYEFHIHARFTSPSKDTRLQFKFYKVDASGGNPTLILTSEESDLLTTDFQELNFHNFGDEASLLPTDRLTMQLLVRISGGGSNPTVELQIEGDTDSRLEIPSPSPTRELFLPYSGARFNVDLGVHNITTTGNYNIVSAIDPSATARIYKDGSFPYSLLIDNEVQGDINIRNLVSNRDLIFQVNQGGTPRTLTWDADIDKWKFSTGLFDIDDADFITAGKGTFKDFTLGPLIGFANDVKIDFGTVFSSDFTTPTFEGQSGQGIDGLGIKGRLTLFSDDNFPILDFVKPVVNSSRIRYDGDLNKIFFELASSYSFDDDVDIDGDLGVNAIQGTNIDATISLIGVSLNVGNGGIYMHMTDSGVFGVIKDLTDWEGSKGLDGTSSAVPGGTGSGEVEIMGGGGDGWDATSPGDDASDGGFGGSVTISPGQGGTGGVDAWGTDGAGGASGFYKIILPAGGVSGDGVAGPDGYFQIEDESNNPLFKVNKTDVWIYDKLYVETTIENNGTFLTHSPSVFCGVQEDVCFGIDFATKETDWCQKNQGNWICDNNNLGILNKLISVDNAQALNVLHRNNARICINNSHSYSRETGCYYDEPKVIKKCESIPYQYWDGSCKENEWLKCNYNLTTSWNINTRTCYYDEIKECINQGKEWDGNKCVDGIRICLDDRSNYWTGSECISITSLRQTG